MNRPALAVAVEDTGTVRWNRELGSEIEVLTIREQGLRDSIRARAEIRRLAPNPATVLVALEIDALIADDAATARADLQRMGQSQNDGTTVRYVGTVSGLLSLILDSYTTEVADGVIVHPLDGSPTADRIVDELLPRLVARALPATAAGC
ncbi:hypothetical protein BJF84_21550 [Rhodococcus sp. CUA-806]|jgi:hypothetical protein|nr:hypothetical protein BJF84_21550 [Rhodococcus sp. CUA-806]